MEEPVQDVRVRTSAEGVKRFLEGSIWQDLLGEMKVWDAQLLSGYDTCSSVEDLRWLQGARESISYCMQLPERILEGLEEAKRQDDENETSDKI
jgi:hypothetical protein